MRKKKYDPSAVQIADLNMREMRALLADQAYWLWEVMVAKRRKVDKIRLDAAKALPATIRALLETDRHVGKMDVSELEVLAKRLEEARQAIHGTAPARVRLPIATPTDSDVH